MTGSLASLLGSAPCGCGACRRVETERVHVTRDVADALIAELDGRPALLFGDPRTLEACGDDLAAWLRASGAVCRVFDLEAPGTRLHADAATVRGARDVLAREAAEALPVAVGSGTVNDVVKAAAHELRRPYVAVATAASMNGYTSAIAAITVDGLKRTLPSTPPRAVLASPKVLAESPVRMSVSGLADLLSKPVSSADWRLSHILWGDPYCPTPASVAEEAVERAVAIAGRLHAGDEEAVTTLLEALLLSGISMAVAGSSSPASGGEHLISHFLDMTAAYEAGGPREPALHGEQVGVGTRVTARLYRALLALPASRIDWERASANAPTVDSLREILDAETWLPQGLRDLFFQEGSRKLKRTGSPSGRVARIRGAWPDLVSALRPDAEAAARYEDVLPSVGAPVTARDIEVAPESFRRAVRLARWVRERYTILDLVDDVGLWAEHEAVAMLGVC